MKILVIVEDVPTQSYLETVIAEQMPSAEVKIVQVSQDALACMESENFDVAFLGMELPGMHGLFLAKRLQRINPNINIIFVTSETQYVQDAMALHASGYIRHPLTEADIASELGALRHPVA